MNAMYEMYPEWGLAPHVADNAAHASTWTGPLQESLDLRDNGGERPDDD